MPLNWPAPGVCSLRRTLPCTVLHNPQNSSERETLLFPQIQVSKQAHRQVKELARSTQLRFESGQFGFRVPALHPTTASHVLMLSIARQKKKKSHKKGRDALPGFCRLQLPWRTGMPVFLTNCLKISIQAQLIFWCHLLYISDIGDPGKVDFPEFMPLFPCAFSFLGLLFNCSVMSNSLRSHGLLYTRLSCPSLSPWVCLNSCSRVDK